MRRRIRRRIKQLEEREVICTRTARKQYRVG
jgi:hypothetical protein